MTADLKFAFRPSVPLGQRVLVVEDEYLIADFLHQALTGSGAIVLGPFSNIRSAAKALDGDATVDAAVLDIKLPDGDVYALCSQLRRRQIPFGFSTGWNPQAIPAEFRDSPVWEKPSDLDAILEWLADLKADRQALR